jgi:hypothetical protein
MRQVERRVAQQEAFVQRMIVQGTPTQEAEDRLRQFQQTLSRMKAQNKQRRTLEVQRKLPDR